MTDKEEKERVRDLEEGARSTDARFDRLEAKLDALEVKVDKRFDDTSTIIGDMVMEVRSGRTGLRVLLWVGGILSSIAAFSTWVWIELKKMKP